jgi:hypothetical protein
MRFSMFLEFNKDFICPKLHDPSTYLLPAELQYHSRCGKLHLPQFLRAHSVGAYAERCHIPLVDNWWHD